LPYLKDRPPLQFLRRPTEFSLVERPELVARTVHNGPFIAAALAQHELLRQLRKAVIPPYTSVSNWLEKRNVVPPLKKHRWQSCSPARSGSRCPTSPRS
jgi:hypothetical protein